MDSDFSVALYGEGALPSDSVALLMERESQRLNAVFSDYDPNSELSHVRGAVGDTVRVSAELYFVLAAALRMQSESGGAFDIGLHALKKSYGLGSGETPKVPGEKEIRAALPMRKKGVDEKLPSNNLPLRLIGKDRVVLQQHDLLLDLGGIAKGYTVDRMHRMLDSLGLSLHLLKAGGDMLAGGEKPGGWKLGIRHPAHADSICATVSKKGGMAISTSGNYERYFKKNGKRYHHLFDPATGKPVYGTVSVTVITREGILSDALSTALFVLGPEKGKHLAREKGAAVLWVLERDGELCGKLLEKEGISLLLWGMPACK